MDFVRIVFTFGFPGPFETKIYIQTTSSLVTHLYTNLFSCTGFKKDTGSEISWVVQFHV